MRANEILEAVAATIIQRGKGDGYDPTATTLRIHLLI